MKLNQKGLNLIKEFEGFRSEAYQCSAGVWTIGYGTTRLPNGKPVTQGITITKSEAEKLLLEQVKTYENRVNELITNELQVSQNMFNALVSFTYNLGVNCADLPLICKLTETGAYGRATQIMELYNKAGGKVNQGLINRRKRETDTYLTNVFGTNLTDLKDNTINSTMIYYKTSLYTDMQLTKKYKPLQQGEIIQNTHLVNIVSSKGKKYLVYKFYSKYSEQNLYFRILTK